MTQPANRSRLSVLFVLLMALAMWSCAEFDKGVGKNLVGGDEDGEIKEVTIPADLVSTYDRGDRVKYSSTQLHLGEEDGYHSDIILWFTNFANLGEVLELDSARLHLWSNGYVDPDNIDPDDEWQAELLQFAETFVPYTHDYEYAQTIEKTPVDTVLLGTVDDDLDTFEVNEFTMTLDTLTLDTLLLYIRPLEQATFIKRFVTYSSASDADYLPRLSASGTFVVNEDTLEDTTLYVNPLYTTWYTDDSSLPADPDHVVYSQGYARDMLFQGDFTTIDPTQHSINRVDLVITHDSDWDRQIGNSSSMTWYDITEEWSADPDTIIVGSMSELAYFVPDSTGQVRINVTPIARQWAALPETNFGVDIRAVVTGLTLSRRAFFAGTDAVNPDYRPYFHVVYTEFQKP